MQIRPETHQQQTDTNATDGGVHMQFLAIASIAFTSPDQNWAGGHVYLLINNGLNSQLMDGTRSARGAVWITS